MQSARSTGRDSSAAGTVFCATDVKSSAASLCAATVTAVRAKREQKDSAGKPGRPEIEKQSLSRPQKQLQVRSVDCTCSELTNRMLCTVIVRSEAAGQSLHVPRDKVTEKVRCRGGSSTHRRGIKSESDFCRFDFHGSTQEIR